MLTIPPGGLVQEQQDEQNTGVAVLLVGTPNSKRRYSRYLKRTFLKFFCKKNKILL